MTAIFRPYVLFDIDGTLLTDAGAGRAAVGRALAQYCKRAQSEVDALVKTVDFRGRTDNMLFAELCTLFGLHVADAAQPVLALYLEHLAECLKAKRAALLPGVARLLATFCEREVPCGLLTGNVRRAAKLKLHQVGLEDLCEAPGGFGDDADGRPAVAKVALSRLRRLGHAESDVVVVGDTQHDISAGRAAGARCVAVASGWTPKDELMAAGPDLLFESLDGDHVFDQLLALVTG